MIIKKYNAICNLGQNIDDIYKKAIVGDNTHFDYLQNNRLALIKCDLPNINDEVYNLRCNKLLLKVLEPIEIEKLDKTTTAIVVATTNSGVEEYETSKNSKHFQIGNPAEFLHNYYGFKNYYTSVSTACSSGIKAFAIAKELLDSMHSVIYYSAFDLFDAFARNTFSNSDTTEGENDYILNCDLLIIDDLGTELTNSFVASQFFLCINERILRKKSTVISTNLTLGSFMDTYSERVFSRVSSNYTMIKLIGKDIRIQKKILGGN